MANPIFQQMQKQGVPGSSALQNNFMSFMQQMRGKDPNTVINELVQSGRINQQQLNQVQQQAQQMAGMFNGFRSMFGFR